MEATTKPSGIPWLGDIPLDWNTTRIISTYTQRSVKVSDKDYPPLSVGKMGVVPQLESVAKTDDGDNRKLVKKNDFVINSRADRRGACGISAQDGSVSLINIVLSPLRDICNEYYSFLFTSERFADEFFRLGNGIVDDLWSTRWDDMKRIYIPAPCKEEQQTIADFLDSECGKIDGIIADMETQVEILQRYKKSLITETATKGLDKSAPMKNSGIAWIGQIPKHWGLNKIRFVVQERIEAGQYTSEDNFLGLENVESNTGKYVKTDSEYEGGVADIYHKGDVLFNKLRPYLAKVYLAESDGHCTGEFVVIKEYDGEKRYLFYYFLSHGFLEIVDASTYGTKMPRASWDYIRNLVIPICDIKEQQAIADYLDEKCAEIDAILVDKQKAIDTMREYKKSLIYEYVTGKKRVKGGQTKCL
jgi:type I restriction enzyme S subunit